MFCLWNCWITFYFNNSNFLDVPKQFLWKIWKTSSVLTRKTCLTIQNLTVTLELSQGDLHWQCYDKDKHINKTNMNTFYVLCNPKFLCHISLILQGETLNYLCESMTQHSLPRNSPKEFLSQGLMLEVNGWNMASNFRV